MIGNNKITFTNLPCFGDRLTIDNVVMNEVITYKSHNKQWYCKVIDIYHLGIFVRNYNIIVSLDNTGIIMKLDSFCDRYKNKPSFDKEIGNIGNIKLYIFIFI
jgi:hypothetical protein